MAATSHDTLCRIFAIIKPDDAELVPVGKSTHAIVDAIDFEMVSQYLWVQSGGYARSRSGTEVVLMHRLVIGATSDQLVDHIDGDGLNNRRSNLRVCTHAENMRNRNRVSGVSRFKGVHFEKCGWRAQIRVNGKRFSLGVFGTQIAAAKAYDKAAKEMHGTFAKTNAELGLY